MTMRMRKGRPWLLILLLAFTLLLAVSTVRAEGASSYRIVLTAPGGWTDSHGAVIKVTVTDREHIPCASSGEKNRNNYQPVPYEKDSEDYKRVMSKLDGSFSGQNLSIGYGYSANE